MLGAWVHPWAHTVFPRPQGQQILPLTHVNKYTNISITTSQHTLVKQWSVLASFDSNGPLLILYCFALYLAVSEISSKMLFAPLLTATRKKRFVVIPLL